MAFIQANPNQKDAPMATRYLTPDGGRVDVISLSLTGSLHQDGEWLRVTGSYGNYVGMVRTPAELSKLGVNVADLREAS